MKSLILSCLALTAYGAVNLHELNRVISKAQQNIWAELEDDTWNFPTYLGTWFLSEYYFELKALGVKNTKFNESLFTQILRDSQLPDGSWEQVHESNLPTGGLDPTIFNYWYLKSVGENHTAPHMLRAKDWILTQGGIEAAQTMSKFKLAVFGQFHWDALAPIPLQLFYKEGPLATAYAKDMVAQWVYPHLTALTFLRHHKTVFKHGADIRELWVREPTYFAIDEVPSDHEPHPDVLNLAHEILGVRQKRGSFGGYTISTLLSLLAL
jgi:squalene-hopene/tetraprenyl-beta-curcumene cyclase